MPAVEIFYLNPSHHLTNPQLNVARDEHVSTFATRAEGGGGISVGAVVGIIFAVVLVIGLVLGIYLRNRNRPRSQSHPHPQPIYYPQSQGHSQKKSFFALSPPTAQAQYLPTYITPSTTTTTTYGHQNHGGVTMPQAVHPSTEGYYARATPGQSEDRVRFGQVGVVRY